jgi:hypothetical protein
MVEKHMVGIKIFDTYPFSKSSHSPTPIPPLPIKTQNRDYD